MKISDMLQPDAVTPELRGRDAPSVLAELCAPISGALGIEAAELAAALAKRESLASTGLGDGVAVPHDRHPNVRRLTASFGRSREGVAFGAPDGRPIQLFFVLLMPQESGSADLNALARVSQLLRSAPLRSALLAAAGAGEIYQLFLEADRKARSVA